MSLCQHFLVFYINNLENKSGTRFKVLKVNQILDLVSLESSCSVQDIFYFISNFFNEAEQATLFKFASGIFLVFFALQWGFVWL